MLFWPVREKKYMFNTRLYEGKKKKKKKKKKKLLQTTFKNGKREKKNDHKKTDFRIVILDGSSKVM